MVVDGKKKYKKKLGVAKSLCSKNKKGTKNVLLLLIRMCVYIQLAS
jgi:hypothetical protein